MIKIILPRRSRSERLIDMDGLGHGVEFRTAHTQEGKPAVTQPRGQPGMGSGLVGGQFCAQRPQQEFDPSDPSRGARLMHWLHPNALA